MRNKIISAMLALCMAGSLLTGCGTSADAGKKSKDSGDEVEKLYKVDGMQLCSRCALVELEVVEL